MMSTITQLNDACSAKSKERCVFSLRTLVEVEEVLIEIGDRHKQGFNISTKTICLTHKLHLS